MLLAGVMAAVAAALPAQVPPGLQFAELGKRHLPLDAEASRAVAHGDVDGDGDLDLVVGNYGFGPLGAERLYLNDGTGAFVDATAGRMPVVFDATCAVALGDVDGDGDLDLVTGNRGGQNRLYLNNGTGTFTDATAGRMPVDLDRTMAVELADFDGDGDLDLATANLVQQNRLYLNNGTGTFTDATTGRMPVAAYYSTALDAGDVDGDGDLDLVVGCGDYGHRTRLYLNIGAGRFTDASATRMPFLVAYTASVRLGDVDGDGDLDLVVGNGGQDRLCLNNGAGTFTDVTSSRLPAINDNTRSVALGDVDGDGDLDLVVGNFREQDRLYLNNGGGTFADATASRLPPGADATWAVALGDVDGDGDLDLANGNDGSNRLFLNSGTGVFTAGVTSRTPRDAVGNFSDTVAFGDVDGDGDLDLLMGKFEQDLLHVNDGTGRFEDATGGQMPVDSDWTWSLALGDVDGDGDLDLVTGNNGQNRLYLNNGAGGFTDATAGRMPTSIDNTRSVAFGDVDGDGDLDLVSGNSGQQSRLYRNNGTGTFTDVTAGHMPVRADYSNAVAFGDVDGDGDLDLVIGNGSYNPFPQRTLLYLNDGTGSFAEASVGQMPTLPDYTEWVMPGDVDGDGDLDLVLGNRPRHVRIFLNDGAGTFSDGTAGRMPVVNDPTITRPALVDVDGDGDLDLVTRRLYLNNGAGTFSDVTATRIPGDNGAVASVAMGDVDGDGDPDMAIRAGLRSVLYLNLQRQLDAPYLLRSGRAYKLDVHARYGPPSQFDVAVPFLSTTRLGIPVPPFGVLGIDPMVSLPPVVIPTLTGTGTVTWLVPNTPAFAGIEIFAQAAILHVPLELRLGNVTADVLIR
ncbi:MAG: FG-GAP-like repeat-containing protein [Planctomycetes bacterium]|nr:FG-GAP-like repeat-containing protein [Planctomycetota bacterium]